MDFVSRNSRDNLVDDLGLLFAALMSLTWILCVILAKMDETVEAHSSHRAASTRN